MSHVPRLLRMGDVLIHILRGVILAVAAFGAVYWYMMGWRVRRAMRREPFVRAGLATPEPAGGWPRVSVIIPAHNESRVIAMCARRLLAQRYNNLEVIFVLDRCTDSTRELLEAVIADDDRVRVVENDECPTDWAGKCYAAHLGAQEATGDYLLFTDADTEFDADLVHAAVGLAIARELDLLSLLSTLTDRHWFERIVQPVAGTVLLAMYPIDRVNRHEGGRSFANGQFLLFRSDSYRAVGGHARVKDDLLEDIALARQIRRAKKRQGIFMADAMLRCSMYDSYEAFLRGWRRIFIEACKRKPKRLRKAAVRLWMLGLGVPAAQLAALVWSIAALIGDGNRWLAVLGLFIVAIGWVLQAIATRQTYRLAGAPCWAAWLHAYGAIVIGWTLWQSARDLDRRTPIRWGGREYILEPEH